jgi:SAM-dependent methyltransferase
MGEALTSEVVDSKLLGWGIDDPVVVIILVATGILSFAVGLFLYFYLGGLGSVEAEGALIASGFVGVMLIGFAAFLTLNSSVAKYRQALILASILPLGGGELVLDVGCGRGPFSVAVARQLSTGLVVGLDDWSRWHVTGNSPLSLMANAKVEGVDQMIFPVKGGLDSLPFPDARFDVVASCLGLSHVGTGADLETTVAQMVRVLKEGGRVAILSAGYGRRFPSLLKSMGLTDIKVTRFIAGSFPYAERITARKRFASEAESSA